MDRNEEIKNETNKIFFLLALPGGLLGGLYPLLSLDSRIISVNSYIFILYPIVLVICLPIIYLVINKGIKKKYQSKE